MLGQEAPSVAGRIGGVDAQEGGAPAVPCRRCREQAELGAARRAPRGPRVDDDRIAAQRAQPGRQCRLVAEQLTRLPVQRIQWRW